ncbi:MAG: PspC domain-containing protein [Defluviitaleaceae bacterium]|nr:PspC domain-containing protein [Defluviitaleaceae bacterium]
MKKLYRSDDAKLLGVCGGIAEYLNIDPTVIRLLWIASLFVSFGTSAVVYVVMAFVMPPK